MPIQKLSKTKISQLDYKVLASKRLYSNIPVNPSDLVSEAKNPNNKSISVKFYDNIYSMRKSILKENKGKSGIYMLSNKLADGKYVGQSADLSHRFKNYFISDT